jgi:transcriptional regulator GlxA family with amidase domain
MKLSIIAFDQFTDIDVFLMWDLLKRVKISDWDIRILGENSHHTSTTGITIPMHDRLSWANEADVVLFSSGPGTRIKIKDEKFLSSFHLDPKRQMIGSMCSGALILAALGLLDGNQATTYPTAKALLETFGVEVVEKAFVVNGNVATAAGCLAAQYLTGWVIERLAGLETRQLVLSSIQPVGEGLSFDNLNLDKLYANPAGGQIGQVTSN